MSFTLLTHPHPKLQRWRHHGVKVLVLVLFGLASAVLVSACSSLPSKPVRAAMYDFGAGSVPPPGGLTSAAPQAPRPPLALARVTTPGGALDNLAVLYRLGYADAHQLRPYAQARWSMQPSQLVGQRLRDALAQGGPIFSVGEGPVLTRVQGVPLQTLHVELQEFSHLFESPARSFGVLRLRVSLTQGSPSGEKLLAQREFNIRQPAPSADAAGGVRALTAATDAAALQLMAWLAQSQPK